MKIYKNPSTYTFFPPRTHLFYRIKFMYKYTSTIVVSGVLLFIYFFLEHTVLFNKQLLISTPAVCKILFQLY